MENEEMPYYNLLIVEDRRMLSAAAKDRHESLAIFGAEVERDLSLDHSDAAAPYLLDEWEEGPDWVNPTISDFQAPQE